MHHLNRAQNHIQVLQRLFFPDFFPLSNKRRHNAIQKEWFSSRIQQHAAFCEKIRIADLFIR